MTTSPMPARRESLLLVDDDPGTIQLLGKILAGVGDLRFATQGSVALEMARAQPPDLILLDAEMPDMSGFQVCEAMKADPLLADIPVIFVTAHSDASFEVAGFAIGAVDFIAKPVSAPLVQARVQTQLRLKRVSDELRRLSLVDPLTGVGNRRRFEDALDREWRRAHRDGQPLSLMLADIDHFKQFNDLYGHPTGDQCLRSVATAMASALLRPGDIVTRYGGEEFAVVLPQTSRIAAQYVAHRLLGVVEALQIEHADSPTASHVTMSLGISCYDDENGCWRSKPPDSRSNEDDPAGCSAADLLFAADGALYAAKGAGRARAMMLELGESDGVATAFTLSASDWVPLTA